MKTLKQKSLSFESLGYQPGSGNGGTLHCPIVLTIHGPRLLHKTLPELLIVQQRCLPITKAMGPIARRACRVVARGRMDGNEINAKKRSKMQLAE